MKANRTVTVFGAYGHTGRFVVSELRRRGFAPILSGRDSDKLRTLGATQTGLEVRPGSVDDPASLDRALVGAAAVINCAGPFALTSAPVIEAALRARIPCLDIAAEVEVASAAFEQYDGRARDAGIIIVPAMAFYGGLGDLLATAAMGDWPAADEICLTYGLDSWKPTAGTRATIQTSKRRRGGRRLVYVNRRLEYRTDDAAIVDWVFPAPIGKQPVVAEFVTADSVTIPRHLRTSELRSYVTVAPLADLSDSSPPVAADESGRSADVPRRGGGSFGRSGASRGGARARHLCDHRTARGRSHGPSRRRAHWDLRCRRCRRGLRRARLPAIAGTGASRARPAVSGCAYAYANSSLSLSSHSSATLAIVCSRSSNSS